MIKYLAFATMIVLAPAEASATYCLDKYEAAITQVSSSLGANLKRTETIQGRLRDIYTRTSQISVGMAEAASKVPIDIATIQALGTEQNNLNKEKASLENEAFSLQDQIAAQKGAIPAQLQGELRGCVDATAPADQLVNITIQVLAILSTGGASLLLPPKALYVDMGAVLNGYPTGGDSSVINQARQGALNALGIGGDSNDLGRAIKDPVGAIRGLFK